MKKPIINTVRISSSKDYLFFNFFSFNRKVDKNHVKNLVKSMKIRGFIGSLIVIKTSIIDGIERLYVLDGQHRFTAAKELDIEFKFEIVHIKTELALAHYIADVNNSSKAWGTNQFLDVWSKMKIREYVKLQEVYQKTKIQITPLVATYTGDGSMNDFRKGAMIFYNEAKSDQIIKQIMELDVLPSKAFCRRAIVKMMQDERYNHEVHAPMITRYANLNGFTENETELKKELFTLLN